MQARGAANCAYENLLNALGKGKKVSHLKSPPPFPSTLDPFFLELMGQPAGKRGRPHDADVANIVNK